jgi:lipoyl(octanoyl) transferase
MLTTIERGIDGPPLDYQEGWALQRALHEEVSSGTRPGTLLLCQHDPVYTAGRRAHRSELPDPELTDTPVVAVDRGGRVTWHGPGQLVGYPIVRLHEPIDVVAYVHTLEEALIRVVADHGVRAVRVDGRSGVWVQRPGAPDAKLAAIGVRVARGVTMHGFALNVDHSLEAYDRIVPCGLPDAAVTTLAAASHRPATVAGLVGEVVRALDDLLPAVAELPRATAA